MILYTLVLAPIIVATLLYLLPFKSYKLFVVIFQTLLLGLAITLFIRIDVIHQSTLIHSLSGLDSPLAINLVADNISALFVVLTVFLFLAMVVYQLSEDFVDRRFIFLFLILEGLINGIFLSQDLFNMYALVEVATIIVSILIMYKKDGRSIYDGLVYLLTNMISMTFFLFGVGYIYKIFGTLDLNQIRILLPQVEDPKTLILPYTFLMTAIGLKSALMPVFSWLPRAYGLSAPYIVSAILSGIYVKSSLYIFIRIQAIFSEVLGTQELFLLLGFMTAIIGLIVALSQNDIKLILAFSTISQLGLIIFGISLNTDNGYYGAIYHIFNHAIFKSTLFITAGLLIDHYNTRDITKMRGAFKSMPYVSIVMIVAILGVTGAPMFNGSLSKYLIQKGTTSNTLLETALILMSIGTLTYFIKFSTIFFGESVKSKFLYFHQKLILGLLGLLCFLGGVGGHYFVGLFFEIKDPWQFSDYLEKFIIYSFSLTFAYLFYQFVYKKLRFFKTIQELELSFNELVFSISLFFVGILGYLLVTIK